MKSAGYSGTPLDKKLGIKAGASVWLIDPPPGFAKALQALSPEMKLARSSTSPRAHDVIVCFVKSKQSLQKNFTTAKKRLIVNGGLWIAWPKLTSGVATDLRESIVREHGLAKGLVDNKICAIDETWSGLRFVIPLSAR